MMRRYRHVSLLSPTLGGDESRTPTTHKPALIVSHQLVERISTGFLYTSMCNISLVCHYLLNTATFMNACVFFKYIYIIKLALPQGLPG